VFWFDLLLALAGLAVALLLRPWRVLPAGGPPWPWLAWAATMPLLWLADRVAATPIAQPLSGACLLMLMCGWPIAVLTLPLLALAAGAIGGLGGVEALHRGVWLGLVPATLALMLGAALRRWVAHHLFVYILGRGFIGTAVATAAAGSTEAALHGAPAGLSVADLALARGLAAFGDAWLSGLMVAVFVAFRPQWLATYADRIYLPPKPPGGR